MSKFQAKIPNTDGRHQVHTDTEIITSEILNHRIVGRFMERVQYLRRMQVVPIDAPKTIRGNSQHYCHFNLFKTTITYNFAEKRCNAK